MNGKKKRKKRKKERHYYLYVNSQYEYTQNTQLPIYLILLSFVHRYFE